MAHHEFLISIRLHLSLLAVGIIAQTSIEKGQKEKYLGIFAENINGILYFCRTKSLFLIFLLSLPLLVRPIGTVR
ncbi:MAG: hypothetical protein ACI382_05090 [Alloprevotella sp.]